MKVLNSISQQIISEQHWCWTTFWYGIFKFCIFNFQTTVRNISLLNGPDWKFAFSSAYLFECSLCEQVTLDSAECFMRVVVSLFYQSQFFSLGLVQTTLYTAIHNRDDSEISKKKIIWNPRLENAPWILQLISFFFWTVQCNVKKRQWDGNDTL